MMNNHLLCADLHIHSNFSDSDRSIPDILRYARDQGLGCIAITDHDSVSGVAQAKALGLEYSIEVIEGIELSAQHLDAEIHILGYLIDEESVALHNAVSNMKEIRTERILLMADRLTALGKKIDTTELFKTIQSAVPTRLHLALYMLRKQYVSTIGEAFRKYLSYGKSAYVARFRFSVQEAIRIIKDAGGIAFLAHPHFLPQKTWIKDFVDYGLEGIEVCYPHYTREKTVYFSKIASHYGLLMSGGSDSHGTYKEFTDIGQIQIPYGWVKELKDARRPLTYKKNI